MRVLTSVASSAIIQQVTGICVKDAKSETDFTMATTSDEQSRWGMCGICTAGRGAMTCGYGFAFVALLINRAIA
jgi:hypothetical protein